MGLTQQLSSFANVVRGAECLLIHPSLLKLFVEGKVAKSSQCFETFLQGGHRPHGVVQGTQTRIGNVYMIHEVKSKYQLFSIP